MDLVAQAMEEDNIIKAQAKKIVVNTKKEIISKYKEVNNELVVELMGSVGTKRPSIPNICYVHQNSNADIKLAKFISDKGDIEV